ncbi:MAG: 2-oxoacid:ferredoxin oxidoreductase subunit beta [Candidatus Eisenbacteria bacterium]|nr:2-oxoacid:ferredoxin oxidoreductase subunit beta [Candidatus Eisenbacteria bacterium]
MIQQQESTIVEHHPMDVLLRQDRIPHIWCSGCGLGTSLTAFINAVRDCGIPLEKISVVSGIGCTGRVAGYLNLDSFHTTHGRALPFAVGLHLGNPSLKVIVFSGDGDLISIGGNHFIHTARKNMDITVICVNNFNYGMTGGQGAPTTPLGSRSTTTPYGNFEFPFNIPHLAAASGATYVARWTALDTRRLKNSMQEAILRRGFSVVEVISPCPTLFGRLNRLGTGLDMMKSYQENSVIRHGADPASVAMGKDGKIIVGKFVDIERPTYLDMMKQALGGRFNIPIPERSVDKTEIPMDGE